MKEQTSYLVGYYDPVDGEFWCKGEYIDKDKATAAFEKCCKSFPDKHIDLVQVIKMHKVIDTYYPSARTK